MSKSLLSSKDLEELKARAGSDWNPRLISKAFEWLVSTKRGEKLLIGLTSIHLHNKLQMADQICDPHAT